MKQKTKEIQIQNIPLQEQNKEYQLILWDICLALVLITGSLISFVESRERGRERVWECKESAVTAGIGLLGSVLAQQSGEKNFYKGDTLRDSMAVSADRYRVSRIPDWIPFLDQCDHHRMESVTGGRCSPF